MTALRLVPIVLLALLGVVVWRGGVRGAVEAMVEDEGRRAVKVFVECSVCGKDWYAPNDECMMAHDASPASVVFLTNLYNNTVAAIEPDTYQKLLEQLRDLRMSRDAAITRAEAAERVVEAVRAWADDQAKLGEWVPGAVLKALAAYDERRTEDDGE